MNHKISVIIPVYNVEDYLSKCLQSVINQTYTNLEIILVDDGSTDNSGEICDEFSENDNRIKVIHQKNTGVSQARKIGIDVADGKYIGFVDADDWIEPDMYETLINKMKNSDIIMSGLFFHMNDAVKKIPMNNFENTYYGPDNLNLFFEKMIYSFENDKATNIGSLCNNLFLTEKLKSVIKNIDFDIKHWEDFYVLVNYLLDCQSVEITKDVFYHYIYRENSLSRRKNINILFEYNQLYSGLIQNIQKHYYSDILTKQLNKWFVAIVNTSFEQYFHFDKNICPIEYVGDVKGLEGKRIVLYCAGNCGQSIYKQLNYFNYNVVMWVDAKYQEYQKAGLEIHSPDDIKKIEYDVVYIAVDSPDTADDIKRNLLKLNVKSENIIYSKPLKNY